VVPASLYSPALDREMPYEVILPPDYEASEQSYPVLYLLHGYAGWSHSWVELRMAETADYFWSRPAGQGKLDHFIIVLPEGENSYFLNHADDGARWGDYLVEDVVQHVDATYRTRADARYRAIGGLSMGADGALQLALNHPQVFSIAGAHSPTTRLSYDLAPGGFYGEEAYWQEHNPLWLVANTERAQQLKIWIDSGSEDDWLPNAQALHEALEAQGIEHHYEASAGGHTAEYWIGSSPAYLRFYAQAFAEVTTLVEAELEPAESDQTEL
jgi:S-formylglutathione hydrolase FrmB